MNKFLYYMAGVLACLNLASCEFLDREPLDFGDENAYYKTAEDLKMAVNDFYEVLPKNEYLWGGVFATDNTSDNQIGSSPSDLFYEGNKRTVQQSSSEWKFTHLRGINYFINHSEEQIAKGEVTGTDEYINHYVGEGYFFRAWEHYRLLRNFGDAPIVTKMLPDDKNELAEATRRKPRNEVARAIIGDLDKAYTLMMQNAPETGRLCKDAALMLKARVALYEGTWERYHANTAFVPGNPKWVGAAMYPDFTFKAGSAEAEINWFLEQAIEAADLVASNRKLDNDYISMFNSLVPFSNTDEVILARYYSYGVLSHSVSNYLIRTGAGTGYTRSLVNSFLMKDGTPIYKSSSYKGDKQMKDEMTDRDPRLVSSVKIAERNIVTKTDPETGKLYNDTLGWYRPHLELSGNESSTTGYDMKKWQSDVAGQEYQGQGTSANPIFRAAEAYLIYIEAYYERYGSLGGKCDQYWQAIRQRAGVNANYQNTISQTELSQENDLAVYSKGVEVDRTLYNIRRERRCEFIAEGMRLDDLKRWRSLDNMRNYQPEGMNLWEEMYSMYDGINLNGVVSPQSVSNYIRPLQKSTTIVCYDGYNFPKPHYLEPIPIAEFLLAVDATGKCTLYQNPGWPTSSDGTADYGYDCD